MKIKLFLGSSHGGNTEKLWYFNVTARNGKKVLQSEGYKHQTKAIQTLRSIFTWPTADYLLQIAKLEGPDMRLGTNRSPDNKKDEPSRKEK